MRGGSARKHLIYFQARTGRVVVRPKAVTRRSTKPGRAVHAGFVEAIRLAEAGQWAESSRSPASAAVARS